MSNLWIDIETLVLDGVPLNPAQGRRLAYLTELSLTRLLDQRGTSTRLSAKELDTDIHHLRPATARVPQHANEARWAEELALVLYRALDRTL